MKYQANPVTVEAHKITAIESVKELPASNHATDVIIYCDLNTVEEVDGVERKKILKKKIPYSMTSRYQPVVGDYLVIQEDGYEYLNPKEVFERKYSPVAVTREKSEPRGQSQAGKAKKAASSKKTNKS